MTLPPVVIEVPASDATSPHIAVLVDSCTQAVSDGECRVGALAGTTPRAVVIVSWDSDRKRARIEIGIRHDDGGRWLTRDVEFREADPEAERWRSVGLMIGTLVGESERAPPAPPSPPPTPPTTTAARPMTRAKPAVATPPAPESKRVWLGLEALAGPGLDDGSFRSGGGLVAVWDTPWEPALASASVRYAASPEDETGVRVRWLSVAAGAGAHAQPTGSVRLEGRAEALVERTEAALEGFESDQGERWTAGIRLTATGGLEPVAGVLVLLGADLNAMSRGTKVVLRGAEAGRAPPLTWTVQVGARVGF